MIVYTHFIDLTNYFAKVLSKHLSAAILKLWEQTFCAEKEFISPAQREFIFERKDFMKFKVVGKSLILTDYSHKITEGENSFDTVEIAAPHYHDECDLSTLSFRFSEISENGETAAVQILRHEKCDEKYIYLKGAITSDFSAITGKVFFILTGVSGENVVAKFQSDSLTVSDDISLASLPNTTTAEQLFNRAQLEVQKAIAAAERAEKASQTPAPAEIYPASETNLGGVKVNGKTITASADGTISVSDTIVNTAHLSVQIAHPNNFLIYDNAGKPSVMVAIPKFYLDEVIDGASHTVHPAFIINGVEHDMIYISKYQNIVENERAYSLPINVPKTWVSFDQAWNYCQNKGSGWHLMTNAEWAAIALLCKKIGTMPKGNNNSGKDISEANLPQKAIAATYGSDGRINKILTGSGGISWNHDDTEAGIADLNGNVFEWNSGMRLNDGEIQIIANNNAADRNNSVSSSNAPWKAIMPDGSLVPVGTSGSLKYDWKNTKHVVSTVIADRSTKSRHNTFESIAADTNTAIPEIIKALALYPADKDGYGENRLYIINSGEQFPLRGGNWLGGTNSGLFRLDLDIARSYSSGGIGFRCCYYDPNQA